MNRRSFFLTSLLSLCIAAPLAAIGCAAPTDPPEASEEQVADSQDELTAAASHLVGTFWTHRPATAGFARLELKSNGHYTAHLDPAGAIVCVTYPCLLPESGTWNATNKPGGGYRLQIRPTGHAARWYDATKTSTTLKLTHGGVTETLGKLTANACIDNADCKSTEECGSIRACLSICLPNDPACCGAGSCRPKPPPPPPPPPPAQFCGGFAGIACPANQDCVDDPTDGCDPKHGGADCGGTCQPRVSTPCGPNTCGTGKVCCNPLAGICTNPGEFCIQ